MTSAAHIRILQVGTLVVTANALSVQEWQKLENWRGDRDLELRQDEANDACFWALASGFGESIECPTAYAAGGACGSGDGKHCDGYVHKLQCCQLNTGIQYNCDKKGGMWGETVTCPYSQVVTGSCGSGDWADCSGYSAQALCCDMPELTLDHSDSYLIQGSFGETLTCNKNYVMTSLCGSGKLLDCTDHGGQYCWEATCTKFSNEPYDPTDRRLIFHETWDNFDHWLHEVTFGVHNNEFQYYRNDRKNSYLEDGVLTINPTITADEHDSWFLFEGTIELGSDCTSDPCSKTGYWDSIIHPVQSARMITRDRFSFKYGRVEVELKMPNGDWLWPAFWLMPQYSVYGGWPTSGEIDMLEIRANEGLQCWGQEYGRRCADSTIHYGPTPGGAGKSQEGAHYCTPTGDLGDGFHKYAMEWTPTGIHTYMDDNLVLSVDAPSGGFFNKGGWSGYNPWAGGTDLAPFDQEFYLIINLAVGGDYFPDGCVNTAELQKPWYYGQPSQKRSFWWGGSDEYNEDRASFRTWTDPTYQVKEIKVYEYNGY